MVLLTCLRQVAVWVRVTRRFPAGFLSRIAQQRYSDPIFSEPLAVSIVRDIERGRNRVRSASLPYSILRTSRRAQIQANQFVFASGIEKSLGQRGISAGKERQNLRLRIGLELCRGRKSAHKLAFFG